MERLKQCQARQFGDQMQCARCGLAWDVDDPDRPECRRERNADKGRKVLRDLREGLK